MIDILIDSVKHEIFRRRKMFQLELFYSCDVWSHDNAYIVDTDQGGANACVCVHKHPPSRGVGGHFVL